MDENNLPLLPGADGEREACGPHAPNSECEEIVYMLAKTSGYKKLKAAVAVLCPSCAQQFKKLLT